METTVEEKILDFLKVEKVENILDQDYSYKLKNSGFKIKEEEKNCSRLSEFSYITPESIYNYIDLKLGQLKKQYNFVPTKGYDIKERHFEHYYNKDGILYIGNSSEDRIIVKTLFKYKSFLGLKNYSKGKTLAFKWIEEHIKHFEAKPPEHILDSIIKNKYKFDYITIATVKHEIENFDIKYTDPIVIGRMNGDVNRYIIDWWDKDIDLSELKIK